LHGAAVRGFQPEVLNLAVKGQAEVGGVSKPLAVFQRPRETALMSLVSTPMTLCACNAAITCAVGSEPVVPRSGAR